MGVGRQQDALAFAALQSALPSTSGYVRATCPFCPALVGKDDQRMSLSFKVKGGWYKCWRCDTRGKVKKVPDWLLYLDTIEKPTVETFDEPEGFVELSSGSMLARIPLEYMASRGVGERIIREAQVGACHTGFLAFRIVVPILSRDRCFWVGYSARDWTNTSPLRYRYPKGMQRRHILYNAAALDIDSPEPILAVEGVFDALPYWPHCVAFLGKPSEEQVEMLLTTQRPIVVVLDGDAWREGWALAQRLKLFGVRAASVRLMPKTDPNSVDRKWLVQEARRAIG